MNFLPSKIKKIRFIDDVLEINDQSRCILSGPPCIGRPVEFCNCGPWFGGRLILEKKIWKHFGGLTGLTGCTEMTSRFFPLQTVLAQNAMLLKCVP